MENKNISITIMNYIHDIYHVHYFIINHDYLGSFITSIDKTDLIEFILKEKINEIEGHNIYNSPISRIFTPENILENNEELVIKMYLEKILNHDRKPKKSSIYNQ